MKHLNKYTLLTGIILILTVSIIAQKRTIKKDDVTPIVIQDSDLAESMARGEEVYTDFCMQCHLPDGKGTPKVIPPLVGSDWLKDKQEESIHAIKYGLSGSIKVNGEIYNSAMASQGLEDEEVADVMNYIMNSWGNTQKSMVTVKAVEAVKK